MIIIKNDDMYFNVYDCFSAIIKIEHWIQAHCVGNLPQNIKWLI